MGVVGGACNAMPVAPQWQEGEAQPPPDGPNQKGHDMAVEDPNHEDEGEDEGEEEGTSQALASKVRHARGRRGGDEEGGGSTLNGALRLL